MKLVVFFGLILCITICSCEKAYMGCNLMVDTYIQQTKEDDVVRTNSFGGYVVYGDTTTFTVASFEDAKNGVITDKLTGAQLTYNEQSYYDNEISRMIFNNLTESYAIVIIYDEVSLNYAYKQQLVVEGLSELDVKFTMTPWKFTEEVKSYRDGDWWFKH